MCVLPSGACALLLELDSLEEVLAHYTALQGAELPVLDLVPAGLATLGHRRPRHRPEGAGLPVAEHRAG